jgi:DNA transposition AAA+ family ATPase
MTKTPPVAPGFVVTKEYRRFAEFCDACRQYRYIGVCHGPPGVGKTLSARHYTHWDQLDPMLHDHVDHLERPADLVNWHAILYTPAVYVYTPAVYVSPKRLDRQIMGLCQLHAFRIEEVLHLATAAYPPTQTATELILIDEADRLKLLPLEQVRDFYDRSGVGMVLIGMPGLQKRLSRYPQFYSRVGFVHEFHVLSSVELEFVVRHKWRELGLALSADDFDSVEALASVVRITGGNFRLPQRLFNQVERIMAINGLTRITDEVVQAARESLVIGLT